MPTNILVYRTGSLGDTVVSLPALWAIRRGHPNAHLVLLTNTSPAERRIGPWDILEKTGLFSEVVFYTSFARGFTGMSASCALGARIRRLRPSILYYLAPTPRTGMQAFRDSVFFRRLCGIRHCFGLQATNNWVGKRDGAGPIPVIPEFLRLLRVVGGAAGDTGFPIPIDNEDRRCIDLLWQRAAIPLGAKVIALAPGAATSVARWPQENYRALAQRLLSKFPDSYLLVVGGPDESRTAQELREKLGPRIVNGTARLSVWQSAEAICRCSLFVGNDSGAMHVAAMMGVRCVAVFSARAHPGMWEPWGEGHIVIRKPVPCAGCQLDECKTQKTVCMTDITVAEVFDACVSALNPSNSSCATVLPVA
jgi:ADP-heptose:LPS heptosyltransferase